MPTGAGSAETIETAAGHFWLEGGLLRFVAKEQSEQSQADAEESMRVFAQLAGGTRRPAVMVILGVKKLSREARALYTGERAARTFTAVAIVVAGSTVARALFNFIMAVSKPRFPARVFETVDEAVEWARGQVLPDAR